MLKSFNNKINIFLNIIVYIYLIFGLFFSLKTGISADEFIDQHNWKLSFEVIKNFLLNLNNSSLDIINYEWKFHGVGFHYISQPYVLLLSNFFKFDNLPLEVSKILINHSLIFITFFLSGLCAKNIVQLIIKDKFFSKVFLIFYLSYPYLLGHAFYNPKDTPFLFVWILCTYLSLKTSINLFKKNKIFLLDIFLLSIATAFLFSIRLSGILILIQYFITFFITSIILKKTFLSFFKLYSFKILFFTFSTFILTIILYPIFWTNPLLIVDAITQMKNIPYGVCTLTLSNCMDSLKLPSSYIFIWLFFKLPVLCILGLLVFPFVEKKIFTNSESQILIGSVLLSVISIIFLLVFLGVNLYDELRHILFLVPLILIITFSFLYFFSKKILLFLSIASILIFSIQNINMYPYQYTWFNSFGNFINLNENFELDYWGVSGRNIANKINNNEKLLLNKDKCIYVAPKHIIEPFISNKYNCVKSFFSIYPKSSEKYILVKYTRNIRRENPSNCKLIFEEGYNLNIFGNYLKMGEVFICN